MCNDLSSLSGVTIPKHILKTNVGLACALAEAWMSSCGVYVNFDMKEERFIHTILGKKEHRNTSLQKEIVEKAISNCIWPGRYHVIHANGIK